MEKTIKNTEQIVIYDNRVNVSLQGLKKRDYDVFMVCAYRLKDMKNEQIEISYSELMSVAQLKHYTIDEFHKYLREEENISAIRVCCEDQEGNIAKTPIFKKFLGNRQKKKLTLKVNDEFINLFSELTNNFTTLDLVRYTGLKSKYSKILYQNLCQYRNLKTKKGFWNIPLNDNYSEKQPTGFKTIFGVPKELNQKYYRRDIINPAIRELASYMQIKCNTILDGRKTVGYQFNFEEIKQKAIEQKDKLENKQLPDISSQIEESLFDQIIDLLDNAKLGIAVKSTIACANKAIELNRDMIYIKDVINIVKSQSCNNVAGKLMHLIVNGYDKPKKTQKSIFKQREVDKKELDALEEKILQRNLK